MATLKSSSENLTLNADGANNDVIIQSNGSTKVTVDGQNSRVGIGITSPTSTLHVNNIITVGASGVADGHIVSHNALILKALGNQDNIIFKTDDSDVERMRIGGASGYVGIGTSGAPSLLGLGQDSGSGDSAACSGITFKTSNNDDMFQISTVGGGSAAVRGLKFSVDGTEKMRMTGAGGLTFNGDTAAANALDDYEKGSHECAITMGSGTATLHSSRRFLKYVKIGDQVSVSGQIQISAVSSPSGAFQISLPFTNSGDEADFSVGNYRSYAVDTPGDGVQAVIFSERGTAKASLQWSRDSAISTNENATNGGYYMIGLTYFTA